MKIDLSNTSEEVVSDAFTEKLSNGVFLLVVNTLEKHRRYDYTIHNCNPTYLEFRYEDPMNPNSDDVAILTLHPESEEDEEILSRPRYELMCKDQLEILFLNQEKL